ncbi:hypothetical protein B446_14295 [Streptomyces collinus Tu 365]|uniref:Uncharacterized protein n=1 Tax=Streptomyces collinus (strain DSM 40733 / Tue 365) TaxID=1214242 RepID=S5VGJ4_STRC3|nr:hypothetical protein [Streptomyces collinus]AGS69677.1 hypothetical protein B446_14295 [Streptomyces collinus Tu 365]
MWRSTSFFRVHWAGRRSSRPSRTKVARTAASGPPPVGGAGRPAPEQAAEQVVGDGQSVRCAVHDHALLAQSQQREGRVLRGQPGRLGDPLGTVRAQRHGGQGAHPALLRQQPDQLPGPLG